MGRRPNAVIAEFFQRGNKLSDNSNRYSQRCKLCGEHFPKGRMDSMTNHLTRHCQVITEPQRVRACLALNGIPNPQSSRSLQHAARHHGAQHAQRLQQQQQQHQHQHQHQQQQAQMPPIDLSLLQSQQGWTPLETLAEVSRQINHLSGSNASAHGEEASQSHNSMAATGIDPMSGVEMTPTSAAANATPGPDSFHAQEHFNLSSPQSSSLRKESEQLDHQGAMEPERQMSSVHGENQIRTDTATDVDANLTETPNLTVTAAAAAAAAARLNSTAMLDPGVFGDIERSLEAELEANLGEELARAIGAVDRANIDGENEVAGTHANSIAASHATSDTQHPDNTTTSTGFPTAISHQHRDSTPNSIPQMTAPSAGDMPASDEHLGWSEITYMSNNGTTPTPQRATPMVGMPTRSVFRVDQTGSQGRHHRSRFSEPRRKEVQSIRKLGACIRCRILRKTCSEGDPCQTCRKVLSPRIWRTGCVRTRVTDKLDIYNARVQAYHCSRHFEAYKTAMDLKHPEVDLEAIQADTSTVFEVKVRLGTKAGELYDPTLSAEYQNVVRKVVMIDTDASQNLPEKMQAYVSSVLPELVGGEEAAFSRITLETAQAVHAEEVRKAETAGQKSEEIRKAAKTLELAVALWGYVEVIERELKWSYKVRPSPLVRVAAHTITRESDEDVFKMLGLQLTAAAEMMAEKTSKELLARLQGHLSDGKSPIGPPIFFAVLVLLICVEKTTWAFMSWEQIPELRNAWPLEKQPDYFTKQGDGLADGLRMLLMIRKALPTTMVREEDCALVDADPESEYRNYFQRVNLNIDHVYRQRFDPPFHPTTSRTLELRFCSIVILPEDLLDASQASLHMAPGSELSTVPDAAVHSEPLPQSNGDSATREETNDGNASEDHNAPLVNNEQASTELSSTSQT